MPRMAPNAAFTVGRSFPGQGPETNPYPRNDVTRRNVRVRRDPYITDRDRRDVGLDIDPPMPPLRLGAPYKSSPDSAQVRTGTGPAAGGLPHPSTGCSCGQH